MASLDASFTLVTENSQELAQKLNGVRGILGVFNIKVKGLVITYQVKQSEIGPL